MNRDEIMNIIPHRGSMLLLDSAELGADGTAYGEYAIRGDEWFLNGHFPGNPVVPGVVLCEIVAQASCVLFADEMKDKTPFYAGIDKARFRRMVKPGDVLKIKASLLRNKMGVFVIKGEAHVDGTLCVSGEFSFILAGQEA